MDARGWRRDVIREFLRTKELADRAMAQLDDAHFFAAPGPETNPIALVVKHMAGNQRSRWTDFLTTDGEKPDRHRDTEFERGPEDTRTALMTRWEAGWSLVFAALEALGDADLDRTVTIRGEPHTVVQAVNRQVSHYAYHAGQIVLLARHYVGAGWKTLSVAKGASAAFNRAPEGYLGGGTAR